MIKKPGSRSTVIKPLKEFYKMKKVTKVWGKTRTNKTRKFLRVFERDNIRWKSKNKHRTHLKRILTTKIERATPFC